MKTYLWPLESGQQTRRTEKLITRHFSIHWKYCADAPLQEYKEPFVRRMKVQCGICQRKRILTKELLEQIDSNAQPNNNRCDCSIDSASPDYNETYHPKFNNYFKTKIKTRDNYTCQICGAKDNLCIHHINYDKNNDCSNPKDFLTVCTSHNSSMNANRPLQTKRCKEIIKRIYSIAN